MRPSAARPGDPIVALLAAWRTAPSEDASIAVCDRLRAHPVREAEVLYVAQTIERLHGRSVPVLLALGRLQLARGLLSQAQRTFVLVGRAEKAESGTMPKATLTNAPTIPVTATPQAPTSARRTSSLLLDVLCRIDDDGGDPRGGEDGEGDAPAAAEEARGLIGRRLTSTPRSRR